MVFSDGDFVIRAAGVVCPSLVGKDALRDDLEIVQVENLLKRRASVHQGLATAVLVGDGPSRL